MYLYILAFPQAAIRLADNRVFETLVLPLRISKTVIHVNGDLGGFWGFPCWNSPNESVPVIKVPKSAQYFPGVTQWRFYIGLGGLGGAKPPNHEKRRI